MPRTARGAPQRQQNQSHDDDDDDDDDAAPETGGSAIIPRNHQSAATGDADEVEQLLGQLGARGSEARIIVWRVTANADPEECIDCPLNVFSKDQLREQFGSGRYRCEVRHKGTMKRRWEWRFAAPASRAPGAAAVPVADASAARVAELQAQLAAAREKDSQRQHELLLAVLGRPQAGGLQLSDLAAIKELFGAGEKGSPISQFKEFLEIRELMGGEGGGGGGATGADIALEGLRLLPRLIDAGGNSAGDGAAAPALPAPGKPRPAAPATAAKASMLDQYVDALLHHAHQGTAPAVVAQFIYGKLQDLDDDSYETICSSIESPGAMRMGLALAPRLVPVKEWLQQVLDQIRGLISADSGEESLTDTGTGPQGSPEGQPPT